MSRLKFLTLFVIIISLSLMGCSFNSVTSAEEKTVQINRASDNSVNGYRASSPQNSESDNTIDASCVTVGTASQSYSASSENSADNGAAIQYCANINSRVFHLKSCGSVSNIKQENRLYLSERDELISLGYTPCKRCNP